MTASGRRVVVTGGSGFLGSHITDALLARGDEVVCVDNLSTGYERNVAHLAGDSAFTFVKADVCDGLVVDGPVDAVMHFASPASPPRYLELPIETLRVGAIGTERALQLAELKGARFMVASTSEVYGDPLVHPQPESYWGHVNSIGMRSCYDEAKRYAEAVTMAYRRARNVDTVILRIFNTYGPRLDPADGRVVSNLLSQALRGEPLTIYGDGSQTRSFCFVADEVRGILALLDSGLPGPVNIGNPNEFTMLELAEQVRTVVGGASEIVFEALPADDPKQRQPDITIARKQLGWEPQVQLAEGLALTAEWFRTVV
jgi:nucleoside-diphosphate-sugar epimerase